MVNKDDELADELDGQTNVNSTVTDCNDDNNDVTFQQYRAEYYRLQTFADWPRQHSIAKETLAENGFIYLGNGDRVKCVFCNVVLRDWEAGDVVRVEHSRHSPRCSFLIGESNQNIPYDRSHSVDDAAYPQYRDFNARLKTYEKFWPKSMKQRPRQLAAAGFFYLGMS